MQTAFVPNDVTAMNVVLPARNAGPPESPKHVPPLLELNFTNSELIEKLLAVSLACVAKRVKNASGVGVQVRHTDHLRS